MLFKGYDEDNDEAEDKNIELLVKASYLPEEIRRAFLQAQGYKGEDLEDMLGTIDELNLADAVADEEAVPDMLEAGLDASIDADENTGNDDKYRSMSKSIMSKAIKGSDGTNEVTNKEEYDFDNDGDPDITITTQNDGSDESESDNASAAEDKPNDEKKLNSNVINAVAEHRL